jgi:hypothetical protein
VLVYLFSDQGGSNKLAYSTDVTGRNIPRPAAGTKWNFVSVIPEQDLHDSEDVIRNLRQRGFHVFNR